MIIISVTISHLARWPDAGHAARSPGSPQCTCTPHMIPGDQCIPSPVQPPVPRGQAWDDQPVVASDPEPGVWSDQQVTHTQHPALVSSQSELGYQTTDQSQPTWWCQAGTHEPSRDTKQGRKASPPTSICTKRAWWYNVLWAVWHIGKVMSSWLVAQLTEKRL